VERQLSLFYRLGATLYTLLQVSSLIASLRFTTGILTLTLCQSANRSALDSTSRSYPSVSSPHSSCRMLMWVEPKLPSHDWLPQYPPAVEYISRCTDEWIVFTIRQSWWRMKNNFLLHMKPRINLASTTSHCDVLSVSTAPSVTFWRWTRYKVFV
jgi:hypothetical protein